MKLANPRIPSVPDEWTTVPLGQVADKIPGKKPDVVADEPGPNLKEYITAEAYSGRISRYADPKTGNK